MKVKVLNEVLRLTLPARKLLSKLCDWTLLYTGLITLVVMIYDLGFPKPEAHYSYLRRYYLFFVALALAVNVVRNMLNLFYEEKQRKHKQIDFAFMLVFLFLYLWLIHKLELPWLRFLEPYYKYIIGPLFLVTIIYEISRNLLSLYRRNVNPAFIFVLVFFLMSLVGAALLMLPNATFDKISLIDAVFTAVSAVCITGLVVVDTAEVFTPFGHIILLFLMQLGGLGIMTFAGLIGQMFSSGITFQQQMLLKEYISGDRLSEVMKTIYKIIFITILVEVFGALLIFFTTLNLPFGSLAERLFFAFFHSVSAFCNAGFVTMEEGMYNPLLRYNYPFQLVIAGLFLFGGIGFPIVFAFYSNIKLVVKNIYRRLFLKIRARHQAHSLDVNSKLMIWTTGVLTVISFALIWLFESKESLEEHHFIGRIVGAFFAASTPRSAGFNTVDMSLITFPTIMLYLLLMWIGSSPAGTGGGIKTTTFSVAVLNFWSIASGKEKIAVFGREVGQESVRRAFAIISLSVVLMGMATFLVYSFDGHLDLINVVFDVFSAFNNCGLSLGITGELTPQSKLVLAMAMFIGRVSALTLFSAFLYRRRFNNYQYPEQDIIF